MKDLFNESEMEIMVSSVKLKNLSDYYQSGIEVLNSVEIEQAFWKVLNLS